MMFDILIGFLTGINFFGMIINIHEKNFGLLFVIQLLVVILGMLYGIGVIE